MKKLLLMMVFAMMTTAIIFAQTPSKMSYQPVIQNVSNDLEPRKEQKIMIIHENNFQVGIETIFNKKQTIQDQTSYYAVIIPSVTKNKSLVTSLIVKFSGHDKKDMAMDLARNGDLVMQNAISIAPLLRKPGAKREVIRLKTENINDSFLVRLMSAGINKQKVIKVVSELGKLNLSEAMEIVNKLGVVAENLSQKEAAIIKKYLETAGASVRIEKMPSSGAQTQSSIFKTEKKKAVAMNSKHHQIKPVEKQKDIVHLSTPEPNTEYRQLLTELNDQLDVKTDADSRKKLTTLIKDNNQRSITNLAKKTGKDASFIKMMAMAQEKSTETGLPAQLYYAIYRKALPTGETSLYIADASTLKKIWKDAIEQHIISASFEDQLAVYLQKFLNEKQIKLPKELPGKKDGRK